MRWTRSNKRIQAPTRAQSTVLLIGAKGSVLAIDRATGEEVWRTGLRGGDFVNLVLDGGAVYAATQGELFCVDPATGQIRWHNPLQAWAAGSSLSRAAGRASCRARSSAGTRRMRRRPRVRRPSARASRGGVAPVAARCAHGDVPRMPAPAGAAPDVDPLVAKDVVPVYDTEAELNRSIDRVQRGQLPNFGHYGFDSTRAETILQDLVRNNACRFVRDCTKLTGVIDAGDTPGSTIRVKRQPAGLSILKWRRRPDPARSRRTKSESSPRRGRVQSHRRLTAPPPL
jgi:hypothetical protein